MEIRADAVLTESEVYLTGRVTATTTPRRTWVPMALALVLAAVSAAAAIGTLIPGVLRGPAVMNGSARGTAWIVLAVAVLLVPVNTWLAERGSMRARIVQLGGAGYLLYNGVMFAFATPFNAMFLLYVGMIGLGIWTLFAALTGTDAAAIAVRTDARVPARPVAVIILTIVALNALAWLAAIVPAVFSGTSPSWLEGTGLTTNPSYVQDLAFWLPAAAVIGVALYRRRVMAVLLAGALLTGWMLECIGVGVDQWLGHAADPGSPVASDMVTPFAFGLGVLVAAVLGLLMRDVDRP